MTTADSDDQRPEERTIRAMRGSTFIPGQYTYKMSIDGAAAVAQSIAGDTITAVLRRQPSARDSDPAAEFDVVVTDEAGGEFYPVLDAATTEDLDGTYVGDVRLVDSSRDDAVVFVDRFKVTFTDNATQEDD